MTDDRNPYEKLRERSKQAEREAWDALLSVSDEDEVSGLIQAVGTLAEANLRATGTARDKTPSDRVEIQTPAGFRVAGKVWYLILLALVIATLVAALRMIHPAFR
jgi:hypothetical protein